MWVPEGARCTGSLLHVFFRVICIRCYEMRMLYVGPGRALLVFYVDPGRSAVHRVSFACVFACNSHTLLQNACIFRGSRKERGARGLFCMCFYV